ncbi:MAG: tyrosine-type recombinase/integrase [Thermodesulfobacteriota bacterium]|nr:tyrosine-type recombinase/integrase [Thermodesulfobacteriota bacterium]
MDIVVVIVEFKNQLKARGYAEATVESYRENLDYFKRCLDERNITDLRKVNRQVITDYHEMVMSLSLAMETKALRIRAVKRLFEYLVESHKLLINPTEGIVETSRKNRKIGTVLTVDEMKKLLDQPNLSLRPHIRNRAIMEVMYSTGIRINELVSLEVYHVDLKDRVIYIRKGKGGKQRVVPLGKEAVKYLKEYLEHIRPWWARKNPKERRLFLNHSGLPLNGDCVRTFLRLYRIAAGIKKTVSPHTIRRTCATHMLQQGADIRYIQKLLGHKSLSTTQTYTKVMPLDLKKTHNKTHPNTRDQGSESRRQDED